MRSLPLPLAGGCQCGGCRYEITERPLTAYVCHCTECQRQSGGAFGMSLPVPRTGFALTQGSPRRWRRLAASGRAIDCVFCPDCGTRLFHQPSRDADVVNVKPGTLDDPRWLRPVGHLWTASAQGWVVIPAGVLAYPGQPTDFAGLRDAWSAQHG